MPNEEEGMFYFHGRENGDEVGSGQPQRTSLDRGLFLNSDLGQILKVQVANRNKIIAVGILRVSESEVETVLWFPFPETRFAFPNHQVR